MNTVVVEGRMFGAKRVCLVEFAELFFKKNISEMQFPHKTGIMVFKVFKFLQENILLPEQRLF